MTQNQFLALCTERYIDPSLALENDEIVAALQSRDDDKVQQLLDSQF